MAAASPISPCSPPASRKILAALPLPPTAISPSAAFADSRTPPSSTAPTTTTPFSPRPAGAIALPTSSRPKSCRSSASPPIPTAPNQGRSGGAVVNVVTKSGSNHVHGTAFYYLRDSSFGATDPFLAFKPHNRQQQVGGTIGG